MTKIRDHVCDSDDYADQHGIRKSQDQHQYKTEHSDDRRVDRLSDDKTAEQTIGFCRNFQDQLNIFYRNKGINNCFAGIDQRTFVCQHINGNHDRNKEVQHPFKDGHGDRIQCRYHICGKILRIVDKVRDRIVDRISQHFRIQRRETLF